MNATVINATPVHFLDQRHDYVLFVKGTDEKEVISKRIGGELPSLLDARQGGTFRLFDAGVGSGDVLLRVLEQAHDLAPRQQFQVVAKEISGTDVRDSLGKLPGFLVEQPNTVVTLTNRPFRDAPTLNGVTVHKDINLQGTSSRQFRDQLDQLQPFLTQFWGTIPNSKGAPVPEYPVALTIRRGEQPATPALANDGHDLIIAAQPYRSRQTPDFKAQNIIAPLLASLATGGRLIGVHAEGDDPAHRIIHALWPEEKPFVNNNASAIFSAVRKQLGDMADQFHLSIDDTALVYHLDPALTDRPGSLGASLSETTFSTAVYVAQMRPDLIADVVAREAHHEVVAEVLRDTHGQIYLNNGVYVIERAVIEAARLVA